MRRCKTLFEPALITFSAEKAPLPRALLPPLTANLPESDADCKGIKPTLHIVIQDR